MALLLSKKPLGKKIVTVFAFICKQRQEYGYGSGSIFICQVNIVLMDTYELKDIDVGFDFTSDTTHYWDGFWKEDDLGWSKKDPDSKSPTLRRYHQLLWSRRLPCGQSMQLTDGRSRYYLRWDEFYMGSDSILVSFRHSDKREVLDAVRKMVPDYHYLSSG